MNAITTIGLGIAKSVFQVHGVVRAIVEEGPSEAAALPKAHSVSRQHYGE